MYIVFEASSDSKSSSMSSLISVCRREMVEVLQNSCTVSITLLFASGVGDNDDDDDTKGDDEAPKPEFPKAPAPTERLLNPLLPKAPFSGGG